MFLTPRTIACSLAVATVATMAPARANLLGTPLDALPVVERVALREGQPYLTEISEGRYVARIAIQAPVETTWEVLTDYGMYSEFLPNVVSSEIVTADESEKTVEQVSVGRAFVFSKKARTLTKIVEEPMQRINFQLIEGDLKTSQGSWTLEPYALHFGAPQDRILLTYSIEIDPGKTFSRSLFFGVFEEAIADTLSAIATEVDSRAGASES